MVPLIVIPRVVSLTTASVVNPLAFKTSANGLVVAVTVATGPKAILEAILFVVALRPIAMPSATFETLLLPMAMALVHAAATEAASPIHMAYVAPAPIVTLLPNANAFDAELVHTDPTTTE